ncbi:MAG: hypothetical protein LUQ47_00975, partial [Methanotrichaceae archaeon]|nr:hypothetical protein [Methanotrichaceae archaeon]
MKRIKWAIKDKEDVIEVALNRYKRFLEQQGRRSTTINTYLFHAKKYLRFAGTDRPSDKELQAYRNYIFD